MPVLSGTSFWAKVYAPQGSKFDPEDKRYSIDVCQMDDDNIEKAVSLGLDVKNDTDGQRGRYVTIRRYAYKKDGTPNARPNVLDASLSPMSSLIGNGSKVKVEFKVFPFKNGPRQGQNGFDLNTVQVLDLVEYSGGAGGGSSELTAVDGGYEEAGAPF